MYTAFASVYDALMRDVPYEDWAAHYLRLLARYGAAGGKCVECACGSGALTIPLKKGGMRVTGVDMSGEMLAIAMRKARETGLLIPFVRQDMCELRVPSRVQAVLATCDGVNYLLTKERLAQFFRAAFGALKAGGVLLFDVSTPYKLLFALGDTRTYVAEDNAYIWHNRVHPAKKTVDMALTIFAKRPDGAYERIEEGQTQRAFEMDELRGALTEAGFERIRFFGGMRLSAPREKDMRWHIAAVKPKDTGRRNDG